MCMLVFVLYGFALDLCEGACVYVHDILYMTMLTVMTSRKMFFLVDGLAKCSLCGMETRGLWRG